MGVKIRVGVVGTRGIARALHLYALSRDDRVQISALCGRDQHRARKVATEFGIPAVYTDHRIMLIEAGLDAVVISSSAYYHYPMILAALESRLHVRSQVPLG